MAAKAIENKWGSEAELHFFKNLSSQSAGVAVITELVHKKTNIILKKTVFVKEYSTLACVKFGLVCLHFQQGYKIGCAVGWFMGDNQCST